jgi:hypothetical protein
MGVVDRAVDADGRTVALKRLALHGSAAEMDAARRRVRREVEALRRVDHPSVIPLLDVVDDGDDVVVVMPYLAGGSLADRVRTSGSLAPNEIERLARHLAAGLVAAQRHGIVHRDVKPSNVLFTDDGRAVLADFGVALLRDATSGLTATGALVGTPDFLAPEIARGESATPASDVFGLGATLLFAATGVGPWGTGEPSVLVARAARGRVTGLRSLTPELRRLIAPMVARSPRRRPAPIDLAAGADGTAIRATGHPRRRGGVSTLVAMGAGAALAGGAVLAALVVGTSETGEPAETAAAAPSPAECTPLPYQPCGEPVATGTDGRSCIAGRADYDGEQANGCEAVPDGIDGDAFRSSLTANLVPADDVDVYPLTISDALDLFCEGRLEVELTAPDGGSMRLELRDGNDLLGQVTSVDGELETLVVEEPSCLGDDGGTLEATVRWVGSRRTGADYELVRRGSF